MSFTHGYSAYVNHKCRCRTCTLEHSKELAFKRAKRAFMLKTDPSLAPHGLPNTYTNWGCRCPECKIAHSEYEKERYAARKRQRAS